MKKHAKPWSSDEDDTLRRFYGRRPAEDLAWLMDRTIQAIRSRAQRLRLGQRGFWTAAADAILRRDYPSTDTADLALRLHRTPESIHSRAHKLGLQKTTQFMAEQQSQLSRAIIEAGRQYRFQPGQKPWNQGRKGWCAEGCQATQFQPGHRPHSWQPIGHERISPEGYLERKITDDGPARRHYVGVHRLLWSEANGLIPPGHVVVFKNGNPRDLCLDNLELISRQDLMRRNSRHRYPQELKEILQARAVLTRTINRMTRESSNP